MAVVGVGVEADGVDAAGVGFFTAVGVALTGVFFTGVVPMADFAVAGVVAGLAVVVGKVFFVPMGVRVVVLLVPLTGVLPATTGVFFAGVASDADDAAGAAAFLDAAGSGFFVPIGVRTGVAFTGVVVLEVALGVALFNFAGVFLTGAFAAVDGVSVFAGVDILGAVEDVAFTGVFFAGCSSVADF